MQHFKLKREEDTTQDVLDQTLEKWEQQQLL